MCSCGPHQQCSCHCHHHGRRSCGCHEPCGCRERRHECSCHAEREGSPHHGRRHDFVSREEYIARLEEERDILERRLRHLKAELEELQKEGHGAH